jgi:protein-tyrosine phosphatase
MVDIHCHILPGLDDGSDNIEESVRMARLAVDSGTKAIIATPHSNIPDSYQNYCDQRYIDTLKTLKERIKEENIPLQIYSGHEIFASGDIVGMLKSKKLLTLRNSDYPLIEFPFKEREETVYRVLRGLVAEGFTPVVAHPERYAFVAEDDFAPIRLKDIGCLLQVNKGSLKGNFGREAFIVSQTLIRHELADFVASDAHSPYMRSTYLADAYGIICEIRSEDYANQLLSINPRKVIRNEKI